MRSGSIWGTGLAVPVTREVSGEVLDRGVSAVVGDFHGVGGTIRIRAAEIGISFRTAKCCGGAKWVIFIAAGMREFSRSSPKSDLEDLPHGIEMVFLACFVATIVDL